MIKIIVSAFILVSLCCFDARSSNAIVVVVAKDSNVNNLTEIEVANIFLARTRYYPNGERALPIELKNSSDRNDFYQAIAGKNSKQLMAYWTTLVFTGKGVPPKAFNDFQPLLDNLLSQKSKITYMASNLVTEQMKVVYRFPNKL